MDQFDRNVTFAMAMRNIARTISSIRDGLSKQSNGVDESNSLLIEFEILICDSILEFLVEFLPHACSDDDEVDVEMDDDEE